MQLDSLNPINWLSLGAIKTWTDFDWKGGEEAFLRSIELNPNKAGTRSGYAHWLLIQNRFQESETQMDIERPWIH